LNFYRACGGFIPVHFIRALHLRKVPRAGFAATQDDRSVVAALAVAGEDLRELVILKRAWLRRTFRLPALAAVDIAALHEAPGNPFHVITA
jgi:hypothetical protein